MGICYWFSISLANAFFWSRTFGIERVSTMKIDARKETSNKLTPLLPGQRFLKEVSPTRKHRCEQPTSGRRFKMTWIKTFEENEARGLLTWVYRVARWRRGRVPNIVKVSSLHPRLLVTLGPLFRTLMEGPSPLSRAQRKMVAIVASKVNNCFY